MKTIVNFLILNIRGTNQIHFPEEKMVSLKAKALFLLEKCLKKTHIVVEINIFIAQKMKMNRWSEIGTHYFVYLFRIQHLCTPYNLSHNKNMNDIFKGSTGHCAIYLKI